VILKGFFFSFSLLQVSVRTRRAVCIYIGCFFLSLKGGGLYC
jgi:hypothetical protein